MRDLDEIIHAYREKGVGLVTLQRLREEGPLEPAVATALVRRMQASQQKAGLPAPDALDAADAPDATKVKPASRPMRHATEAATIVQPAVERAPVHDDATVVKPASGHRTGTGTGGTGGTGSNSSGNQASWRRV